MKSNSGMAAHALPTALPVAEAPVGGASMKILLYCPDNGVTRNFMPHLWMFLLQSLTPPDHEVVLIDGNTHPMSDAELVQYVVEHKIGRASCRERV